MAFLNETGLQKLWEHIDNKFARITEVQSMINNVEAKIPTVPTSLKNPNSLTIKGNGTQSFTYDGSSAKTLNIKPGTNISVSSDTSGNITINATDTNTTYSFTTGDNNGQIAVTPSGGTKQNISVKGLGSAAYTESSAYAAKGPFDNLLQKVDKMQSGETQVNNAVYADGAGEATKLTTNAAGSTTQPVYFDGGIPKPTTHTLGSSVPGDAKFTDTTYTFATGDNDGQIAVIPLGGTKQNVPVKGFDGISSIAYLANTKANELITGAMAANKATNVVINNGADVIQFITHNSTTNLPAVINGAILIAYDA